MEIYQLEVTLSHIKPPIWRRVGYLAKSSSANCTASCRPPWVGPTFICMPSGSAMNVMACPIRTSPPTKNERNIRLDSIVQQGGRFFYDYDFGVRNLAVFRRKPESMASKKFLGPWFASGKKKTRKTCKMRTF